MSGVVAYLERQAGGLLITRVRLLGDGWSGEWRPPARPAGENPGEASGHDDALTRARGAGVWIVEQLDLRRVRALESLVVDADGAVCLWLGTPSAEPAVIAAALLQGSARGDVDGTSVGGDAVMFAAAEGAGTERSIQAATAPEAGTSPAARRSLLSRSSSPVPDSARQRVAVMSVPDAAVRVVLDELDASGIAVDSVTSLWHAAAKAWDPQGVPESGSTESSRFAAESAGGASAVVLVDPIGRLLWSWTREGRMLACGSMLLRRVEVGGAVAALLELEGQNGAADALAAVECSDAEASRLCVDWLGWSAQLGVSPGRIVYVGPPAAGGGGGGRAFAQAIAERWPGTFIDAATDEDPVGLTLSRARTSIPWQDPEIAVDDGQRSLVDLSQRPGRQHRSYYRSIAGAVAAVAVVVGAAGWKMRVAASEAQGRLDAMSAERADALKKLEPRVPGLAAMSDPVGRIRGYINELRNRADRIRPEVPLMNEFQRILLALSEAPGVKINTIDLSNVTALVKLTVPDAETGPRLTTRIQQLPGQLSWTGSSGGSTGGSGRSWTLQGQWLADRPRGTGQ